MTREEALHRLHVERGYPGTLSQESWDDVIRVLSLPCIELEGWEVVAQADCVECAGDRWSGTWSGQGAYVPKVGDREIILRRKP